jgi:hypothetical protein
MFHANLAAGGTSRGHGNRRRQVADTFASAKAKAAKILGKDAKLPDGKGIPKLQTETDAAFSAYQKSCDDLEAKILALQKALSNAKLTIKQIGEKIEDDDFGLDEKNKDDAKKIKEAHDIFSGWSDDKSKTVDDDIKALDELDKHVMDFKKYKPAKTDG